MFLPTAALPVAVAGIYGLCTAGAAGTLALLLGDFGAPLGLPRWTTLVVPALLAAGFALLLYQRPLRRVQRVEQSIGRGVLIALLTWLAVALAAATAGCPAGAYTACLSNALLASGALGGGPLLIAGLAGGFAAGHLIVRHRSLIRLHSDD